MPHSAVRLRLQALIGFRAFFITLLLGSVFIFRVEYITLEYPNSIAYFIVFLYCLTISYALLLNRIQNLQFFAYLQLVVDVLSEIFLIYITGGIESWFSFMLILTVLSSSIVLDKRAGFIIASLSSILYGALLDLQFYGILPLAYEGLHTEKEFFYKVFIHVISLYLTAYLAGYLSYRLEKTVQKLEEKDTHLKDLELFNTKVIESLPSGLITTDVDRKILVFNRAAEKIVGTDRQLAIGKRIEDIFPFLASNLQEGRREESIETQQNGSKIIGINMSILRDISGKNTGFIGIFQDLTQLKKLEDEMKQKDKWAAIGELSANIAHEIRNPLASLKSSIEMLREDRVPSRHRDKLMDIALSEMERLNNIITDFLMYSRPKPLEPQHIDIHALLNETLDLLKNSGPEDVPVSIRKDFKGPLMIYADPQKMRQVFWNLGLNAIEAMANGGELAVKTSDAPETVSISFADTGTGVSQSDKEKIFYPFFTTKETGTGLGLAIAYRIIEEHRGRITVKSIPGTKTIFEIILPKENGAAG